MKLNWHTTLHLEFFPMWFSECGGVIHKKQGHLVLESYPNNARCEWTIQVDRPFTIELR